MAAREGHARQDMPVVSEEEWEPRFLGGTYGVIGLGGALGNTLAGDCSLQKLPKHSLAHRPCGPVHSGMFGQVARTAPGPSISKSTF